MVEIDGMAAAAPQAMMENTNAAPKRLRQEVFAIAVIIWFLQEFQLCRRSKQEVDQWRKARESILQFDDM
jgi:hypothetical protein